MYNYSLILRVESMWQKNENRIMYPLKSWFWYLDHICNALSTQVKRFQRMYNFGFIFFYLVFDIILNVCFNMILAVWPNFQMSFFFKHHDFLEFLGSPEFFKCFVFSNIMILRTFQVPPECLKSPNFSIYFYYVWVKFWSKELREYFLICSSVN